MHDRKCASGLASFPGTRLACKMQVAHNGVVHQKYSTADYFRGTKFSRIAQTKHFADFIFEDRGSNVTTPLQ